MNIKVTPQGKTKGQKEENLQGQEVTASTWKNHQGQEDQTRLKEAEFRKVLWEVEETEKETEGQGHSILERGQGHPILEIEEMQM